MFFALDSFTLKLVFNLYEREHGEGKRKYAEATYAKWRSGEVEMGGEISERLIRIVPRLLKFDQKYELIEKLWNRLRQESTLSVTISPHGGIDAAIQAVVDAVEALDDHEVPPAVVERLEWLAQDDGVAAQVLLAEVSKREGEIAVATLETELRQLLEVASQHQDKAVSALRTVRLPGVRVHVHVSQAAPRGTRRPVMSDKPQEGQPTPLVRRNEDESRRDLAPIENPSDLLGEALRRMPPKKQQEIIGKATDEALRLQVKQKEGQIDHEMTSRKVETAAEYARRQADAGAEFDLTTEHRSEHGFTKLTVRNKPATLSEKLGRCFVATACYGDYGHPAVVVLRRFRDDCLAETPIGRAFIAWYYRIAPAYARRIQGRPLLRLAGRVLLWPVVVGALLAMWIRSRDQTVNERPKFRGEPHAPLLRR